MNFLHNHLGFACAAPKRVLLQSRRATPAGRFRLIDLAQQQVVYRGDLQPLPGVPGWRQRFFAAADVSAVQQPGDYQLLLDGAALPLTSRPLRISPRLFDQQHVSDLVHYFKSQRCSGVFDQADRHCPVLGSDARRDVHGGWYDASGDASKYLSHLSYANHLNPQQTPLVVWALATAGAQLQGASFWLAERIADETLHGADFLCRMQHDEGWFHLTVFDRWSKDVAQRQLCSYATQQGHLLPRLQAGWRQGGGFAIAALARASMLPRDGEGFTRSHYRAAAERGFAHLAEHGRAYLDDGRENIIDDYSALLAAAELFAATGDARYAAASRERAAALAARQHAEGWYWADDAQTRSFFHAADAGAPHLALLRHLQLQSDDAVARQALQRGLAAELRLTQHTVANPFGYPRQQVVMPGQPAKTGFFMPHANESGYWWQGENARLASLAAAALAARPVLADHEAGTGRADGSIEPASLTGYAQDALDWIFGRNPFDVCMVQGAGAHPPRYEPGCWNAPGGVCNGITAGLDDEEDIDFRAPHETTPMHSWRWTEQWLPHGAWLLLALAFSM